MLLKNIFSKHLDKERIPLETSNEGKHFLKLVRNLFSQHKTESIPNILRAISK